MADYGLCRERVASTNELWGPSGPGSCKSKTSISRWVFTRPGPWDKRDRRTLDTDSNPYFPRAYMPSVSEAGTYAMLRCTVHVTMASPEAKTPLLWQGSL